MQNKTSNNPDHNMLESIKKEDKNMTCKDGYCFIPNSDGNKTISHENINIFDPVQINFIGREIYLPDLVCHFNPN